MPNLLRVDQRTANARRVILASIAWLCLSSVAPLWAEPQDRQVAEWVILSGGSVRLEGHPERIREVTQLPEPVLR